jgi:hypothetical protein
MVRKFGPEHVSIGTDHGYTSSRAEAEYKKAEGAARPNRVAWSSLWPEGSLRYDGSRDALADRVAPERRVIVRQVIPALADWGFREDDGRMVASVPAAEANALLSRVLAAHPLVDLGVEAPPLEEVMGRYFREQSA